MSTPPVITAPGRRCSDCGAGLPEDRIKRRCVDCQEDAYELSCALSMDAADEEEDNE